MNVISCIFDDRQYLKYKVNQYRLNVIENNRSCWLVNVFSNVYMGVEIMTELFRTTVNSNLELLENFDSIVADSNLDVLPTRKIVNNILMMRKNLLTGIQVDELLFENIIDEDERDELVVLLCRVLEKDEDEIKELRINVLIASILIIKDESRIAKLLELFENLTNFYIIPKYIDIGYNNSLASDDVIDDCYIFDYIPISLVLVIKSFTLFLKCIDYC